MPKELLISASISLDRYKDQYYLRVITADNYKFYFVRISFAVFVAMQTVENLSVQHLDCEPADVQD